MGLPDIAAAEGADAGNADDNPVESDNGLKLKKTTKQQGAPSASSASDAGDAEFERARMVAKAREIKTSPSETQAVWDPAAFMAAAFRRSSGADDADADAKAAAPSYGSPSETRADVEGLRRRRREEDAEDDDMGEGGMRDGGLLMVDTSPSETRAVGLAEVEAAAMRAQALAVSSSPSDTKAVRVEPEPPLPLLVASSPSETAAVPAEEAASPLLFFSQEGAEAEAEAVVVAEATAAAEQQQLEEPPQPDIVSDMLLMNGDGF